jgi:hypothetical protein
MIAPIVRTLLLLLLINISAAGQNMYKAMMRERTILRTGIGAQFLEPTGINFQIFKGFFCSNNASYATYGVLELGLGAENIWELQQEKSFAGGTWKQGGVRLDLNYLYPLLTLEGKMVLQTYLGAGVQTGTRNYRTGRSDESDFATGGNAIFRIEAVTHAIEVGNRIWFFSVYADAKYHFDFKEDFNYLTPVVGVRFRKGR